MIVPTGFLPPMGASPFAAQTGMTILVPEERRLQLARFSAADLSYTDYKAMDFPLTIGRLSQSQQRAFAPEPAVGNFEYTHRLVVADYSGLSPAALAATARELLSRTENIVAGGVHDRVRPRLQSGDDKIIHGKLAQQAPWVAEILAFDQAHCGGKKVSIALDFVQDCPGPHQAFAPLFHTDQPYQAPVGNKIGQPLSRTITLRSRFGSEFIRDSIYDTPLAQDAVFRAIESGQQLTLPLAQREAWEMRAKAANLLVETGDADVVLRSRELTWHRSKRPAVPERSTLARLTIAPVL